MERQTSNPCRGEKSEKGLWRSAVTDTYVLPVFWKERRLYGL